MPPTAPNPATPIEADRTKPASAALSQELAAEDFYYEGPYLVFTAAYHLKRGYCCNSNCRHCPYRDPA
jgi:hypothetical protein